MKHFSKTLMKSKSPKERQRRLKESIDQLSYNYSDVFTLFFKEMKRRENESNNPYKIHFWFKSSHCYVKLHEALILVKNNNIMAKDKYLDSLKCMLYQTIEHETNIDEAIKICRLIEKSAHLKSINDPLKYLIQRVYQLNDNIMYFNRMRFHPNNVWQNNFNQIQGSLELLNIEHGRPHHIPVIQPSNVKLPQHLSPSELNCYGYNCLNIFVPANNLTYVISPSTYSKLTIVDQDMDEVFAKWLRYLKLQKYEWFFNDLSYREIELIDSDNIEMFIVKVNKNTITRGAQKKICISTKKMRDRNLKLNSLMISLDLEVTPNELCEIITYMQDILHYPIPNINCIAGNQLQLNIICFMEKLYNQLLEKLNMTRTIIPESLLGNSINKFLECTMLIIGNQMFTKQQIYKTSVFAKKMKNKVFKMPITFFHR